MHKFSTFLLFVLINCYFSPLLSQYYTNKKPSRDGIGKFYQGREISKIMGHYGAAWLERISRTNEERPQLAIELLNLERNMVVADFGAGTGYFTAFLAEECSLIFAVDIQLEMLEINKKNMLSKNVKNVKYILNSPKKTELPTNSLDLILLVDVYHELEFPYEVINDMKNSLKNNGTIVLIEFRAEDPSVPIKALHKMSVSQITKEMNFAGMKLHKNIQKLPRQHMLLFKKS